MKILIILMFTLCSNVWASSIVKRTIWLNGRKADLYSPKKVVNKKAPVILALHGGLTDSEVLAEKIKLNKTLIKLGYHGVFLNGTNQRPRLKKMKTWNAGKCCGSAFDQRVDDISYIKGVMTELIKEGIATKEKFILLGSSNGAMMSFHFACENNHLVKTIFSLGGTFASQECRNLDGVGVYFIHGKLDTTVPLKGGGKGQRLMGEPFYPHKKTVGILKKAGAKEVKTTILKTGEHGADTLYKAAIKEYNMDLGELLLHTMRK